jgi:uncharacterized protein with HEPN domain
MNKDPFLFIDHILESINAITKYIENVSKEDFLIQKRHKMQFVEGLKLSVKRRTNLIPSLRNNIQTSHGVK